MLCLEEQRGVNMTVLTARCVDVRQWRKSDIKRTKNKPATICHRLWVGIHSNKRNKQKTVRQDKGLLLFT